MNNTNTIQKSSSFYRKNLNSACSSTVILQMDSWFNRQSDMSKQATYQNRFEFFIHEVHHLERTETINISEITLSIKTY